MSATYGWSVTGLVPGRAFAVTGVELRAGAVAVRYRLRPGIAQHEARDRLALLPQLAVLPRDERGGYVEGGFEPAADVTDGELVCHDDRVTGTEPVTVVLAAVAEPAVTLVLEVAPRSYGRSSPAITGVHASIAIESRAAGSESANV